MLCFSESEPSTRICEQNTIILLGHVYLGLDLLNLRNSIRHRDIRVTSLKASSSQHPLPQLSAKTDLGGDLTLAKGAFFRIAETEPLTRGLGDRRYIISGTPEEKTTLTI